MKHLALLLLFTLTTAAQFPPGSSAAKRIRGTGGTLPSACGVGDLWLRTGATAPGVYGCTAVNTWTGPAAGAGTGDVSAASTFGTDNVIVRSDGTSKGVQASGCTIDDSSVLTCPGGIASSGAGVGVVRLAEGTAPGAGGAAGQHNIYLDSADSLLKSHENGGSVVTYYSTANPPPGGSGAVTCATTEISSSQILNLSTTPITLVAAQGAGTVIAPVQLVLRLNYNSVNYAGGSNLLLNYGSAAGELIVTDTTISGSFVNFPASGIAFQGLAGHGGAAATALANTAVVFRAATPFTTGNSTITAKLCYVLHTF